MNERMEKRRIYCLGIKPIYVETPANGRQWELLPMPSMCFCDFNPEITELIVSLKELVLEKNLDEVSKRTTLVTWFFEQTNRYHVDVPSYIHVSAADVYFTGHLSPHKQTYFQTHQVPLHEILESQEDFQSVDLARLSVPLAKSLMMEIAAKSEEQARISDRYYALDEVFTALAKLDDEVTEPINTSTDTYSVSLSSEIAGLQKTDAALEIEIDELCRKLLYRVFGLSIGDWIYSEVRGRVQLQIESVSFYDNAIILSGPIITKKGEVGKREESIYLNIQSKDEH